MLLEFIGISVTVSTEQPFCRRIPTVARRRTRWWTRWWAVRWLWWAFVRFALPHVYARTRTLAPTKVNQYHVPADSYNFILLDKHLRPIEKPKPINLSTGNEYSRDNPFRKPKFYIGNSTQTLSVSNVNHVPTF